MGNTKDIKRNLEKLAHAYWTLGKDSYSKIDETAENYIRNCTWAYFWDKNISKLTNKFEAYYEKRKLKLKSKYSEK
jgi:hypothetical protein